MSTHRAYGFPNHGPLAMFTVTGLNSLQRFSSQIQADTGWLLP